MRNKDKLIAEIMAVCCVLSTSTFFNMYGMAAAATGEEEEQQVSKTVEQFIYKVIGDDGKPITDEDGNHIIKTQGENIKATIKAKSAKITHNIGCIIYEIDFSDDYSPDRLNEVLTELNLKKDEKGTPIDNYTDIISKTEKEKGTEIFELEHFFNSTSNSLIKFGISAQPTQPNTEGKTEVGLNFIEGKESTNKNNQTQRKGEFLVCRMSDKQPSIQYVENEEDHKMILKIYVDLPELKGYSSFTVTATLEDTSTLSMIINT